jgi:hypothetical protein
MIWEITISVSLKSSDVGDYHILPLTMELDSSKPLIIDQLISGAKKEVARRGKEFDHVVFIKISPKAAA